MKFGIDWRSSFREDVWKYVIYMYTAPGQGQTTPGVNFFSLTVFFSQYSPSLQVFPPSNDFVTVFPIQTYRRPNFTLP